MNKLKSNYFLNFTIIKTLFIILIFCLSSTKIFGAVNDVYYCEMNNLILIKDGKFNSYQEQKFKFKRLENELVFGSEDNYFQNFDLPVLFSAGETFNAGDNIMAIFSYMDGKFYYGASTYDKAYAIDGKCSVF